MELLTYILLFVIVFSFILIWWVSKYNRFQEFIIRINEAEANIDSILRKRFDLLSKAMGFIKLDKYFDLETINKYTSDFISSQFIWFTKNRIICLLKSKIMTGREKRSFLKKIMTSPIYDTKLSKYSLSLKNLVHLKEKHFLLITYLKIKHFFLKKT